MIEKKLKTAVLGLNEGGKLLLEAAERSGYFEIQAVADKDLEAAQAAARAHSCTAYDDYRQLVMQNQFDCLLVAASTHSCDEYLRMAMKKKFNVLKLAPPARNFEEAVQFVRTAEDENVQFAVGTTGRFVESFAALREFLRGPSSNAREQMSSSEAGEEFNLKAEETSRAWAPYLVTAVCTTVNEKFEKWQTDPQLAGGGVLLYDCYEIIDQIIINFGIPQKVYALASNTAGDKQQRLYLTENTAILTMKFSDTLFVTLLASNSFGPVRKELRFYGKERHLVVNDDELVISNELDRKYETLKYGDENSVRAGKLLENFALSILSPENTKLKTGAKGNLGNMAVIEAAYLSAKTGVPEEPSRILEMQKLRL